MADTSLACVCYMGQPSTTKIQDAIRRLNKKNADARVLLALLGADAPMPSMDAVGATFAARSFSSALEAIVQTTSEQRRDATAKTTDIVATMIDSRLG